MADGAEADVASADGEDGADLEEDLAAAAVHLAVDSAVDALPEAEAASAVVGRAAAVPAEAGNFCRVSVRQIWPRSR